MARLRQALGGMALAALAGCASDYPPVRSATPAETATADAGAITFYTAGPGDIMVVSDRCIPARCPNPDGPRYGELVYVGMRSAERAVFRLTDLQTPPEVPLAASHVAHLFVVDRPETPVSQAPFIAPRDEVAPADASVTEIVVNPVAGVAFGTDHLEIVIASATPARVVFTVEPIE